LLDEVLRSGDWEAWMTFFLEGVRETTKAATTTVLRLTEMFDEHRNRIKPTGRRAGSALRVHEALKARPILGLTDVAERTGLSFPAASSGMKALESLGIARELTGRKRNRLFVYDQYLETLNEGTEPL
jgi:Fic family protein